MWRFFTGMPAPAAAGCADHADAGDLRLRSDLAAQLGAQRAVTLFVAVLMVSRVPTFSIKMVVVRVKPECILPTLIFVGLFVAALLNAPWLTLLAVGVAYLVSLPIGMVVAWRLRRQHAQRERPIEPRSHGPATRCGW